MELDRHLGHHPLVDKIKAAALKSELAELDETEQLVPLERFFDGNDDPASIGCNLPDHPGVPAFLGVLRDLASRPEVDAVYLQIAEADPGPTGWPFTDTALVVGSVSVSTVKDSVIGLRPDSVWAVDVHEIPGVVAARHPGREVTAIWWD